MYGISIAKSSHGTVVYVADTGLVDVLDSRIQAFTDDGEFIAKWGSNGDSDGKFHLLGSISVDPSTGYVYAADSGNNRIQVFLAMEPISCSGEMSMRRAL
jgi:DNA-binding beta-propeller fold protein YncE